MTKLLPLALFLLVGCSSGSEGPGETVPGPPRDLVEKGSKPPNGPTPPATTAGP